MIGRILWEGCANGRSACSAGSLCFVEGLQTEHLWLLGKEKIHHLTPERHSWFPSGAQEPVLPWRTPGCPGRKRRRRRGGDAQTDWHPGRDVPPSSPSQNCRIKVSPGLSPGLVVRRVFGRAAAPLARTKPAGVFFGGGKRDGWEVEDALFT